MLICAKKVDQILTEFLSCAKDYHVPKINKEIITFGDTEIKKCKFLYHKNTRFYPVKKIVNTLLVTRMMIIS